MRIFPGCKRAARGKSMRKNRAKRALYTVKRDPIHSEKSPLSKRVLYLLKRALCIETRALHVLNKALFLSGAQGAAHEKSLRQNRASLDSNGYGEGI